MKPESYLLDQPIGYGSGCCETNQVNAYVECEMHSIDRPRRTATPQRAMGVPNALELLKWQFLAATLQNRVEQLQEAAQARHQVPEAEEELRDVSVEQAAAEIRELFQKRPGQNLYYSDLSEELRIDVATIIEACDALVASGVIEAANG
jgi:hypothetical protein